MDFEMKCVYCLKETKNILHKCRSQFIQTQLDEIKDKIIYLLNQGYATSYIANNSEELLGIITTNDRLIFFCKRHSISRRTLKDAANSKVTRELYKKFVEKKYGEGITNVSQSTTVKEKKKQTNIDRYGVENPFQRTEIKNKIKNILLEKYGVENPIHILGRKHFANNTRFTRPHKKISEWLTAKGIIHLNDATGMFKNYNEYLKRNYCPIPDIFIPDKNIIIEIYGDRWHMNPKIYKSTDVVRFFTGELSAIQVWKFDENRIKHLKFFVNDIIILWEDEIKKEFVRITDMLESRLCFN